MKRRVCIVTTTPFIANAFLRPHLLALSSRYDVTLVVNMHDEYALDPAIGHAIRVQHLPMRRKIAPLRDFRALVGLVVLFRRSRFDLVHSVSPKAGLLAMLAAALAGVRVRLHTFQGEVWASKRGPNRWLLKALDQVMARLVTHPLVVSRGEQRFLEEQAVLATARASVLGRGSISGVDVSRFRPDLEMRSRVRQELCIDDRHFVVMYVGRISRDKGLLDLAQAFTRLRIPAALVLVGPDEDGMTRDLRAQTAEAARAVHFTGYGSAPERYMAAADVVCLPSYREGFGLVLLEAGACGLPVLASRIYGTEDAVVDGVTGLFHRPGDIADIQRCLETLGGDPALRARLGGAGQSRVHREFRTEMLVSELLKYYAAALNA